MKLIALLLTWIAFFAGAASTASAQIVPFCFGDGTSGPCPCGNVSAPGTGGCTNALGSAGFLTAFGTGGVPSVTDDISGINRITLHGSGMPNSTCIYFQGSPVTPVLFGDGIRCVNNPFMLQLGRRLNVGGQSFVGGTAGPELSLQGYLGTPLPAPCTRAYQCWYRHAAPFCTPATFHMTNGVLITWAP
jgi:hypothetical protein